LVINGHFFFATNDQISCNVRMPDGGMIGWLKAYI